ncbi:MAG: putative DNA-binding domain-containing protein [Gammaproteobacteria bacterium]|nr:putative DNA-binding domain-containing protein [Gammaproteobacteria bacterium]
MPTLPELQRDFVAAVFDADSERFPGEVRDGRFGGARLFQIYRNNVFLSLTGALAAVYPVVQCLVGAGFFDYLADNFIRAHRPDSGNLHDFGGELAEFLAGFPACADHPYLPDVARLEWAYHRVFHAAAPAFDLAALGAVPPEQYGALRFGLSPGARLIVSDYPLLAIWRANQPGAGDTTVDLGAGGERLLVFRRALEVEFKLLAPGEYALLDALRDGATLEHASERALAAAADFDLAACLQQQVALGTLTNTSTLS